jgi:hypothetical protein
VLSHFPFSSVILLQFTFIFIFVSDISYILCQSFHICVSHSLFGTVFSRSLFGTVLIHSQVQKVPSNSSCYSDSVIFKILLRATLTHPFLLQRLSHFLDFISHFLDIIIRYSDSAIFTTETQPFLDSVGHFWNFVARYSDSVILLQCSVIFWVSSAIFEISLRTTMIQPFCYSDLVILRFYQSFFMISSTIFEISPCATMSQTFFL